MKTYTFQVICASGAVKTYTCETTDWASARRLLAEFVKAN